VKDNSAGIYFTEEDGGGVVWLWRVIKETVNLFLCDLKELRKRGG
jgi:hypothetical protein